MALSPVGSLRRAESGTLIGLPQEIFCLWEYFILASKGTPCYLMPMRKDNHPLRRWLFDNRMTMVDFGSRIGASQGYLSQIMNYQKRPTLDFIDKVTEATEGAITANDFQTGRMETKEKQ